MLDWDIIWKAVTGLGLTGFLLVALFGGGGDGRAFWVYGWLYRQAIKDRDAARDEARQWQRAFLRMVGHADRAVNRTGEAINLANDLLTRRGKDEDLDANP